MSVAAIDDTYLDAANRAYSAGEWNHAVLTTAAPALILAVPFPRVTGVMALAATIGGAVAVAITTLTGRGDYSAGWATLTLGAAASTVFCYFIARARDLIVPPKARTRPAS